MRKREVIEPRKLREAEADAVYGAAGSNAKSIQQDFAGSAGVRERGRARNGIVSVPGRSDRFQKWYRILSEQYRGGGEMVCQKLDQSI